MRETLRRSIWVPLFVIICTLIPLSSPEALRAEDCDVTELSSTFELVQSQIFDRHGCTNSICHGSDAQGDLDLRAGASYANLIDVPAATVNGIARVAPGRKDGSLLFVNLAAKTLPDLWDAPLSSMPLNLPAISIEELELVRLWIEAGAPEAGVVNGTAELTDLCLPAPEPFSIAPLPPPPAGEGLQLRMPRWSLAANSENEVCMASYYDVTDQVPEKFLGPDGTTFRYGYHETRQENVSHHMVPVLYEGAAPPDHPSWGEFTCRGGEQDGEPCDRFAVSSCGADAECSTVPVDSVGCIAFGPGDGGIGFVTPGISITTETSAEFVLEPGVYKELPLKGMIQWSSHAFNLTGSAGNVEAWLNFYFVPPEDQHVPAETIFNIGAIFAMQVAPFQTQEVCNFHRLPADAHLYELSSHQHKRGKRFRTFLGEFSCQGGAGDGRPCDPLGYDFVSQDPCGGSPCVSMSRPPAGDCNRDAIVSVSELVTAVTVAEESAPMNACADADLNGSSSIEINELVSAVQAALYGVPQPEPRDAEASLLYTSFTYSDPVVTRFDPPMTFPFPALAERTLTYCGLYDNGFTDPAAVKRASTSPDPPRAFGLSLGGPCRTPSHCAEGKVGEPCQGATQAERDASCDTDEQAGMCDACPLTGGVTTEDEMFIIFGEYFVRR